MPDTPTYSKASLQALARHVAHSYGIPPAIMLGLVQHESNWDPNTRHVNANGHGTDVGLTQINDYKGKDGKGRSPAEEEGAYDEDGTDQRTDPVRSLEMGASHLMKAYHRTNDWRAALTKYNGSSKYPDAVAAAAKKHFPNEEGLEKLASVEQPPPLEPGPRSGEELNAPGTRLGPVNAPEDAPDMAHAAEPDIGTVLGKSDNGLPLVHMPDGPTEVHPDGLTDEQNAQFSALCNGGIAGMKRGGEVNDGSPDPDGMLTLEHPPAGQNATADSPDSDAPYPADPDPDVMLASEHPPAGQNATADSPDSDAPYPADPYDVTDATPHPDPDEPVPPEAPRRLVALDNSPLRKANTLDEELAKHGQDLLDSTDAEGHPPEPPLNPPPDYIGDHTETPEPLPPAPAPYHPVFESQPAPDHPVFFVNKDGKIHSREMTDEELAAQGQRLLDQGDTVDGVSVEQVPGAPSRYTNEAGQTVAEPAWWQFGGGGGAETTPAQTAYEAAKNKPSAQRTPAELAALNGAPPPAANSAASTGAMAGAAVANDKGEPSDPSASVQPPPVDTGTVQTPHSDFPGAWNQFQPTDAERGQSDLERGQAGEQAALSNETQAIQEAGRQKETLAKKAALEQDRLLQQQKQDAWAAQQSSFQKMGDYQRAIDHVASMKVDPSHFWGSRTTGQAALGYLGILVSGLSGSEHNMAMEGIQKSIDRDIDAQKANIGNAQHAAAGYHNLFEMNLGIFKNADAARLATAAMLKDRLASQGKAIEAHLQVTSDPNAFKSAALTASAGQDRAKLGQAVMDNELKAQSVKSGAIDLKRKIDWQDELDNFAKIQQENAATKPTAGGRFVQKGNTFYDTQKGQTPPPGGPARQPNTTMWRQMIPANRQIQTADGTVMVQNPPTVKQREQLAHVAPVRQALAAMRKLADMGAIGKLSPKAFGRAAADKLTVETEYGPATGTEFNLSSRTDKIWDQALRDPTSISPSQWAEVKANLDEYDKRLQDTERDTITGLGKMLTIH